MVADNAGNVGYFPGAIVDANPDPEELIAACQGWMRTA